MKRGGHLNVENHYAQLDKARCFNRSYNWKYCFRENDSC